MIPRKISRGTTAFLMLLTAWVVYYYHTDIGTALTWTDYNIIQPYGRLLIDLVVTAGVTMVIGFASWGFWITFGKETSIKTALWLLVWTNLIFGCVVLVMGGWFLTPLNWGLAYVVLMMLAQRTVEASQ